MLKLNKIGVGASVAALLTGIHLLLPAQSMGTPGEFAVTDAGAAAYTIPLYTAPGTGNLDARLALQYNSQSSNGVFGVGWSLTGVSSITRCPKTIAEEGERIGVKNDATDIFCLDGQKLRAITGVYGANGTTYRTARESYSQITSVGTQGTGPLSFTVQTKSGAIMQFGATADSRLERPATNTARVWMVNQITDRFNNSIAFSYTKDLTLGEQLLQEVRYSNGKVKLNYEARPTNDPIIKYDDGVQFGSSNSRVSKIEIFDEPVVGGARQMRLFKEYRMAYVQSGATRRSLLTGIQECAPTGSCLPQVGLSYQNTNQVSFVAGELTVRK
jgi:Salmonella virulence plasmid 65kDa B protein